MELLNRSAQMKTIRSEAFRQKLLTLMDGRGDLKHVIFVLNNCVHGDPIVDWLLRHGFKGSRLVEWIQEKHESNTLNMIKFIVAQVNHTNGYRPLYVGKDYHA
jgi:hypothetical protein